MKIEVTFKKKNADERVDLTISGAAEPIRYLLDKLKVAFPSADWIEY